MLILVLVWYIISHVTAFSITVNTARRFLNYEEANMSQYVVSFNPDTPLAYCIAIIPNVATLEEAYNKVVSTYGGSCWKLICGVQTVEEVYKADDVTVVPFGATTNPLSFDELVGNIINGERLPTEMEVVLTNNLWNLYER